MKQDGQNYDAVWLSYGHFRNVTPLSRYASLRRDKPLSVINSFTPFWQSSNLKISQLLCCRKLDEEWNRKNVLLNSFCLNCHTDLKDYIHNHKSKDHLTYLDHGMKELPFVIHHKSQSRKQVLREGNYQQNTSL